MSESFLHRHRRKALVLAAGVALYGGDKMLNGTQDEKKEPKHDVAPYAHDRVPARRDSAPIPEPPVAQEPEEDESAEVDIEQSQFNSTVHWANDIGRMLGPEFRVGVGLGERGSVIQLQDIDGVSYGNIRVQYNLHMSPSLTWDLPPDMTLPLGAYVPYFPFLLDGQINPDAVFDSVSFVDSFRGPVPEMQEVEGSDVSDTAREHVGVYQEEQDTGAQGEADYDTAPSVENIPADSAESPDTGER